VNLKYDECNECGRTNDEDAAGHSCPEAGTQAEEEVVGVLVRQPSLEGEQQVQRNQ